MGFLVTFQKSFSKLWKELATKLSNQGQFVGNIILITLFIGIANCLRKQVGCVKCCFEVAQFVKVLSIEFKCRNPNWTMQTDFQQRFFPHSLK